ncbi:MAG: hypothetical protein PWR13_412 [Archaeoglobi archaeon]|nr:archaeoflavoprotein AfpA [Candidatus Mnemosynella bozhongmuii]MDK2781384.1 hypothetical protein [Archaeoglobi archaeon]
MRRRVAWCITGSGDRIEEVVGVMERITRRFPDVDVRVYLSKAGEQVLKYYRLVERLKNSFGTLRVERNSNSPFLAGELQLGKFDFLLIAPASSNTVAKIAHGIADSLVSNSAIMALKAFIPVYVLPSDLEEGITETILPDGRIMKLRIRKEDAENTRRLSEIEGITVLRNPEEIERVFENYF